MVLDKTLENPLDYKEIQPVNPKEISPEYSLEGLKPGCCSPWGLKELDTTERLN